VLNQSPDLPLLDSNSQIFHVADFDFRIADQSAP
jgi:hypothetical protein